MIGVGLIAGGVVAPLSCDEVQSWTPEGVAPEVLEGEGEEWTLARLPWGEGALRLTRSIPGDGRFEGQVRALIGAAQRADVLNSGRTSGRSLLLGRRCASAWQLIAVSSESEELPEGWELLLKRVAQRLNGIVFREGAFLDHELRLFLAPGEAPHPQAALPVLEDALEHALVAERRIKLFGLAAPPLPPLPGAEETRLRSPLEVADRIQGLWLVALRASGVAAEDVRQLLSARSVADALSPSEAAYLAGEEQDPRFAHRKESLHTLLWALAKAELLGAPRHESDLEGLTKRLRRHTPAAFAENAALRPTEEILEEAAVHYACHGALAQGEPEDPKGRALRPEVVRERTLALLWLLQHLRLGWDALEASL